MDGLKLEKTKGETISIERFRLILYDMYIIDLWYPPFYRKRYDEFKKASCQRWAVDELLDYISRHIYPRAYGSVCEFYELTRDFKTITDRYSKMNPKTQNIFQTANRLADDILDLLQAMK